MSEKHSNLLKKRLRIKPFQKMILNYYSRHGRNLPWRNTKDPYAILISEIMLQQTQVDRVISYYERWLKKWPTVHDLASASLSEVLKEWMGLGYNNRAKNLHQSAKIISGRFEGDVLAALPNHEELPGIGPYTAAAVQIFSANKDIVTVDTNIRRILIHEFKLSEETSDKELWNLAYQCLPKGKSREWHNALMDYGAMQLTSRKSGIKPKTTQSTFQGSDRQIRAKILREILRKKSLTKKELHSFAEDEQRIDRIVAKMVEQGLLISSRKIYLLNEN